MTRERAIAELKRRESLGAPEVPPVQERARAELARRGSSGVPTSTPDAAPAEDTGFMDRIFRGGARGLLEGNSTGLAGAGGEGMSTFPMGTATNIAGGVAEEFQPEIESVLQSIFNTKANIAGNIGGAVVGASRTPGALPMKAVGGFIGGVLGGTGGKEVDQNIFGTQKKEELGKNVFDATIDELFGKVFARVGKSVVGGASDVLDKVTGGKFSQVAGTKSIEPTVLSDPNTGRSVSEAQESLLGERKLTVFEETGGLAGRSQQEKLEANAISSAADSVTESATFENRRKIFKQIQEKLSPGTDVVNFSKGVQDSLKFAKGSFDNKLDTIKKTLIPARTKVDVPIAGIDDNLNAVRSEVFQTLGSRDGQKLFSALEKHLTEATGVPGVKDFKTKMTLAQMEIMKNDIDSAIGKFNPNANTQKKIAGVYSDVVKPILDSYRTAAREGSKGNVRKVFEMQDQFDSVAKARRALIESRVAKRLGLTDSAQTAKALKTEKVENVVFESAQTWQETKDLFDLVGQPEAIGVMQDNFKQKLVKEAFDFSGEVNSGKVGTFIKKYGDDVIRDVAGESWLQAAKDTQIISAALDKTGGLEKLIRSAGGNQTIEDTKRVLFKPLMRRVGLYNLFTTGLRKVAGIPADEAAMLKAFQGERGQRLVEQMISTPLSDPRSYDIFAQGVREINKVHDETGRKPIPLKTREQWNKLTGQAMELVADGFKTGE